VPFVTKTNVEAAIRFNPKELLNGWFELVNGNMRSWLIATERPAQK